jgi:hypothetical protein
MDFSATSVNCIKDPQKLDANWGATYRNSLVAWFSGSYSEEDEEDDESEESSSERDVSDTADSEYSTSIGSVGGGGNRA